MEEQKGDDAARMIPEDWIEIALITMRMITNKGSTRGLC